MGRGRRRGRDRRDVGQRAWERLNDWYLAGEREEAFGEGALGAMVDIGVVRRVLDQAELRAVGAARAGEKSWAEIAALLGITRQSAWERWRHVDTAAPPGGEASQGPSLEALRLEGARQLALD